MGLGLTAGWGWWCQGAGRFIVYDDDSSDDPWSVLEKYAALGILEFHDMKGHPGSGSNELQTNNYNDCFNRVRQHAHEWGLRWCVRKEPTPTLPQLQAGRWLTVAAVVVVVVGNRIIFPDIDEFFLPHDSSSTLSQTLNTHFDHSPCLEVRHGSLHPRLPAPCLLLASLSLAGLRWLPLLTLVVVLSRWHARTSAPRSSTSGRRGW